MEEDKNKSIIQSVANTIKDYGATSSGNNIGQALDGYKPTVGTDTKVFGMRPVNFFLLSILVTTVCAVVIVKTKI